MVISKIIINFAAQNNKTITIMQLNSQNIVVLNNGHIGCVVEYNGKPAYIVFKAYIRRASSYDENGKAKNDAYSIKEVYDGSSVTNVDDIFKSKFNVETLPKLA